MNRPSGVHENVLIFIGRQKLGLFVSGVTPISNLLTACVIDASRWVGLAFNVKIWLRKWTIPEKIQTRGRVEDILFWTPPPPPPSPLEFFIFLLYHWKIQAKQSSTPTYFIKLLNPLQILRPETKLPGNSSLFFLGHPWKFHFVLINPWKFLCYFLDTHGNSISSTPLFGFFLE